MLFNLPTRNEPTIDDIIRKAHTKKEYKPKVKVKGGTLSDKIKAICSKVKQNLGDVEYRLITKDEDFIDYCKKAVGCEFVSLDTETNGVDTMLVNLVGVCIKSTNQDSVYVPVGHISAITEELLDEQVSKKAIHDGLQLLIDSGTKFVFHNAYFDIIILHNQVNVSIKAWFDTLIGAQLLNENEPHGLKQLYAKYCAKSNDFHKFGELFDGIPISYIPPKIAGYYGQFDTVQTEAVCKFQLPYLTVGTKECKEYNLERVAKLFWEDEMPLVDVLVGMKLTGIEFDFKQAEVLKKKYTKLREEAEARFNKAVGPIHEGINRYNFIHKDKPIPIPVNYNSPDQMKAIFYDICGLPNNYYRKNPGATGKEVRDAVLADKKLKDKPIYKIVKALDEVKMYDKAISGFVEKLTDDAIEHGGKIYCDLKQCSTDTGRLSCKSPNLQQCPSKLGDIRTMFKAGDGCVFVNCDFSKQEPCVLASASQDTKLIEVFHSGLDIYGKIASMMYDMPYEECLEFYPDGTTNHEGKDRRSAAKKVTLSEITLLMLEIA